MNNKITIIHSEDHDWSALYIDGKLAAEGHEIRAVDILDELHIDYEEKTVSNEWVENNGGTMPDSEKKCNKGLINE
jgi:hypothetical protein